MTIVVKSMTENTISLPSSLMASLHLREGDSVKIVLEGQILRLSRLESFLSLRGTLAEDQAFDQAMEQINQSWTSWQTPGFV